MREEDFKCDASSPHPSSSSLSQSKFEVEVKLRIKILEEENKHLKMENKNLRGENLRLKRAIGRKDRQKSFSDIKSPSTRYKRINEVSRHLSPCSGYSTPTKTTHNMIRKIRHEVGIFTPEKNKEDKKISPLDDLKMTFSSSLTFNQRRNLKSFLIKLNKDILAPNEKVRSLMQQFQSNYILATKYVDNLLVHYCGNILEFLEWRANSLFKNGLLSDSVWLSLSADKGSSSVKLVVSFGMRSIVDAALRKYLNLVNIPKNNSPFNSSIVAAYIGDENAKNIEAAFSHVFAVLNSINELSIGQVTLPVKWYD